MKNTPPKSAGCFLYDRLEAALTLLLEASTAVNRTITAGLERNLSVLTAAIADHVEHLTLATGSAAVLCTASCAARGATAGLILEALISVELLLRSGENELGAALTASQSLVFEHGIYPPKYVAHTMIAFDAESCHR